VKPKGKIGRVLEVRQREKLPRLSYQLIHDDSEKKTNVEFRSSSFVNDDLSFTIVSGYSTQTHPLDHNYVYVTDEVAWNVEASSSTEVGSIGDLQAVHESDLTNPHSNSFFIAPVWTRREDLYFDSFSFQSPGASLVHTYPKFPFKVGDDYWRYSEGAVYGNITNPGSITFALMTTTNLTFSRRTVKVCPDFITYDSKGCFNCLGGAQLQITAWSTCSAGYVPLSSSNCELLLSALTLTTKHDHYIVPFSASTREGSCVLCLGEGSKKKCHTFKFHLSEETEVHGNNTEEEDTNYSKPPSFKDFLSFKSSAGFITLAIFFYTFIIVFLFFFGAAMFWWYVTYGWKLTKAVILTPLRVLRRWWRKKWMKDPLLKESKE